MSRPRPRLIDRYVFHQLLGPTLLAVAALVALGLISQSLTSLGGLLDERETLTVFVKIVLLAMPQLIVLILPAALLIAALFALNRLHTDHEIVVCFVAGMSRRQVVAPVMRLASLVALVCLLINLWVQPWCYRRLRDTLQEARVDFVANLVRPGRFTHPAPGLTVFASGVDDDGAIHNLFIDRRAPDGRDATITARDGRFRTRPGGPVLVMRQGANQEFTKTGVLNFLSFDEYTLDLRPFLALGGAVRYKPSDRYLHELLFPDPRIADAADRRASLAEAHARLSSPLYAPAFAAIALAAVIGGGYARHGYGGRIALASAGAVISRLLGFAAEAAADQTPALNILQYAVPVATILLAGQVVFARARPPRASAPAARPVGMAA
ncbi:MAG: LPS export ABC transporter permease LptF [Caulobacteraceae bacterium]|nr:LPS export ABC transporter permease LptF [Caulobacteraceae bacterium]